MQYVYPFEKRQEGSRAALGHQISPRVYYWNFKFIAQPSHGEKITEAI